MPKNCIFCPNTPVFWSKKLRIWHLGQYLAPWFKYLGSTSPNIDHTICSDQHLFKNIWFILSMCFSSIILVKFCQIVALFGQYLASGLNYLVSGLKYFGPAMSNMTYLIRPDQDLSKNISFIGSNWYISLLLFDKCCSAGHLPEPFFGQFWLMKIVSSPEKSASPIFLKIADPA